MTAMNKVPWKPILPMNDSNLAKGFSKSKLLSFYWFHFIIHIKFDQFPFLFFLMKQMAPAKQAKVIKEFQKESAQLDMTV